jgi:hypothetical protein
VSAARSSSLPVGVSFTLIPCGLSKRRHPYYVAHIGSLGKKWARGFSVNVHGEAEALRMAVAWRQQMEGSIRRALRRPSSRLGRPGVRAVYSGRPGR